MFFFHIRWTNLHCLYLFTKGFFTWLSVYVEETYVCEMSVSVETLAPNCAPLQDAPPKPAAACLFTSIAQ